MGHPRRPSFIRISLRKKSFSRRDFLRRAGMASAGALSLSLLDACGNSQPPATTVLSPVGGSSSSGGSSSGGGSTADVAFLHGVATGDPLSDRIVFWTRVTPPSAEASVVLGTLTVATDSALKNVVQTTNFSTTAARDFTVKIDLAGLQPATSYYYQFTAGSVLSPLGRTKTLPVATDPVARLRVGVVVCSSLAHGFFNAYRFVANRADLDLVLHLGDYIYEYAEGAYGTARPSEPKNEIITLADYRTRHAQYKRDTDLQAVHRQHPIIAIWDDHETADNSYIDGAVDHQANEGDWQARVANALQAYYEWMPTRPPDPANLKKNYRDFKIGDLVDLYMLEERLLARSKQAESSTTVFQQTGEFADATRTLLGGDQEAWLFNKLRTATGKWQLIGQGVMFGQLKAMGAPNALGTSTYINSDQWDGYDPARSRVFNVLAGDASNPKINNTIVLTGDIHSAWAMDLSRDPNNPAVYNPATGSGSLAVEFVATSVTSPFVEQLSAIPAGLNANPEDPHIKYTNVSHHGYMLLDITPTRLINEFWKVSTIATQGGSESFVLGFSVAAGNNHLDPTPQFSPTIAASNPPPLAP